MRTSSNQEDIHSNLDKTVKKHIVTKYKKPVAKHNEKEFKKILELIKDKKFILDTGCGTGLSTQYLAKLHRDCYILGLDKSENRLNKSSFDIEELSQKNFSYHRIDLIDFFILLDNHRLKAETSYFLYPNPWPKSEHLKKRWHAHPVFPCILKTSKKIVLRTDWQIYIKEFEKTLEFYNYELKSSSKLSLKRGITRFEQKYIEQNRNLYELIANES